MYAKKILLCGLAILGVKAFADCSDAPGPGVNWDSCKIAGKDYKNVDLTKSRLINNNFEFTSLTGAKLSNSFLESNNFNGVLLESANFESAELISNDFFDQTLPYVNYTNAKLEHNSFWVAHMEYSKFINTTFINQEVNGYLDFSIFDNIKTSGYVSFVLGSFKNTTIRNSNLDKVKFGPINLTGAHIENNSVESPSHSKLWMYVNLESATISKNKFNNLDFATESFPNAQITGNTFSNITFNSASFAKATISGNTFSNVVFKEAPFKNAIIKENKFNGSDLDLTDSKIVYDNVFIDSSIVIISTEGTSEIHGNSFPKSDLSSAKIGCIVKVNDFTGAYLTGAHFTQSQGSYLSYNNFTNAHLDDVVLENLSLKDLVLNGNTFKGADISGLQDISTKYGPGSICNDDKCSNILH